MRRLHGLGLLAVTLGVPALARAHPGARASEQWLDQRLAEVPGGPHHLARAEARREQGDLRGAEEDLGAAASSGGADPTRLALEQARVAVARGDDVEAEARLGEALAHSRPEGATAPSRLAIDALSERAAIRERRQASELARGDWDAVFAARPTAEAALARGAIDEDAEDLARAAQGYREALAITRSVAVRRALARVELARGEWDAVRRLADEAMAEGAFDVEWRLVRASAHEGAGRSTDAKADRSEALAEAERALVSRPSDLRRLARARALIACGRIDEARIAIDAIVKARPGLAEARALANEARAGSALPAGPRCSQTRSSGGDRR